MRLIDADKLLEEWDERTDDHRITDSEFHRMINEDLPIIELGWHYPSKGEMPIDNFSYVFVAKDNEVFYGAYVDPMEQWVLYPLNGMQTRYYASKVDAWMPLPELPKEQVCTGQE